jgi:alanine racemase
MRSKHVSVTIDLERIRTNAERIIAATGKPLIAVVKADAYGCGAVSVAHALTGIVSEFAYFTLEEAAEVGHPGLVLGPPDAEPVRFAELQARPTITSDAEADRYRKLPCAINVDTGMQRFGCSVEKLHELVRRCNVRDIWSHCNSRESAQQLNEATAGLGYPRHGASTALLNEPSAWLDAVRPGVALYREAMRVSTRLVVARDTKGPVGYGGFSAERIGIILVGYAYGLRPGPVLINGRPQRMLEVGMNCTYVSIDPADRVGDEVVLLGDGLTAAEVARETQSREHEVLCRYGAIGFRRNLNAKTPRRSLDTTQLTA